MNQSTYSIVLIDDDKDLLEALVLNLQDEFNVKTFTNPAEVMRFIEVNPVDAIVLDYHIPGNNALDVYMGLRTEEAERPVLFLTGEADVAVKLNCLDIGADDFLHKPISIPELAAHLRNRIKSYRRKNPRTLKLKNLEMNFIDPLVSLDGKEVALTPKEFQILSMLAMNPNSVVKKSEMVDRIWPNVKVEENNVDTHISNLRRKLKGFACEMKTVKCFGYMLRL